MPRKSSSLFASFAFIAGFLFLFGLSLLLLWANIEAVMFAGRSVADGPLHALQCPTLITAVDNAAVQLEVHNSQDRTNNFSVQADIARGFVTLVNTQDNRFALQPNEKQQMSWPISGTDAVYNHIVLARVEQLRTGNIPSGASSCGIFFVNTTLLSGQQLFTGGIGLSLVAMALGGFFWWRTQRPLHGRRKILAQFFVMLTPFLLLSLFLNVQRYWLFAILAFVIIALIIAAAFEQLTREQHKLHLN